jgi:predicted deacetylase
MKNAINYLLRLDDACPTMDKAKWDKIEIMLDKYSIKPIVGIIPENKDAELEIDKADPSFWEKASAWQEKGWTIALHGYDHLCLSTDGGINPVHKRSEFAGVSLKNQEDKIEKGLSVLQKHNLTPEYFFAPSHTFDENTLKALVNKTEIRKISDTFARTPYKRGEIIFFPQQFGYFRNIKIPGYWTFCFHPNTMNLEDINTFGKFIQQNQALFISFESIDLKFVKTLSILDKVFQFLYFIKRKIG